MIDEGLRIYECLLCRSIEAEREGALHLCSPDLYEGFVIGLHLVSALHHFVRDQGLT